MTRLTLLLTLALCLWSAAPVRAQEHAPISSDSLLWLGGVLIVTGLAIVLRFRQGRDGASWQDEDDLYEEMKTKPPTREGLDPTIAAALSPTRPVRIVKRTSAEEDELLITTVLFDDKFRDLAAESGGEEMIGWLRLDETPPRDFAITPRGVVIGRSRECDIIVRSDSYVSRKHVQIFVDADGTVWVERLSANSPIIVGGVQVSQRCELKPRDIIQLSAYTRFVFISASAARSSAPV